MSAARGALGEGGARAAASLRRGRMRWLGTIVVWLGLALSTTKLDADERRVALGAELGHFSTSFVADGAHKARAFNIELAASAIDGKTIAPGATFSFNDAVGERTATFGYAKATELRDGMIAEGIGGGTCQVASTLHAAALLGGLEIVARAPHSRPSAYIRMGLDATVVYPSIDLKLRNPTSETLTIRARPKAGTLDVWFDGASTRPTVRLTSEIIERTPFARLVERDKTIADGAVHVKAFGIPGYRVRRTREVRIGEERRRDVRYDAYPPTNEVVRVAPGTALEPDDEHGETPELARVIDAAAVRPVAVQLRPSMQVVLESAPDGASHVK